jgi:hypothetical protein
MSKKKESKPRLANVKKLQIFLAKLKKDGKANN